MNLVERLVQERVSPTSLLHQVTVTSGADYVLCLEGWDDNVYYAHHFRQRRGAVKLDSIRCDKKSSVIWLMEALAKRGYRKGRILFFVDRDLDELVSPVGYDSPTLFVTDFYSFESYLVGEQAFDIVWADLFGMPLRGHEYDHWRQRYLEYLKRVSDFLVVAGAASVCARRAGLKVYLNEVDVGRRFAIDGAGRVIVVGRSRDAMGKSLGATLCGRWRSIRAIAKSLSCESDFKFARGKNLLDATTYFFASMRNIFLAPGSGMVCRRVPHFTTSHLLDSLSARLQCPESLGDFIDAA